MFPDAGDEWDCCCISDTGKYTNADDFIDIDKDDEFIYLDIKEEVLEAEEELIEALGEMEEKEEPKKTAKEIFQEMKEQKAIMKAFMDSVKEYYPDDEDYEGIEEDEDLRESGIIFPEDFAWLKNVEVLRLKSCQWDIHTLSFLKDLLKLRILEVGEVALTDLNGIEKLIGLEKLTIWSN